MAPKEGILLPLCRGFLYLLLMVPLLVPSFVIQAREISSANYLIESSVSSGGGGESFGTGLAVVSVIGQPSMPGTASSENYTLEGGFAAHPISLSIDIKPGDSTNRINPASNGLIPVAILSGASFNAIGDVDAASLKFGRTGAEDSRFLCHDEGEDVNQDGLPDLLCHFETQLTGFGPGDTRGFLSAVTNDGGSILLGEDLIAIAGN